jgi:uncharacterized protein (DUF983 family)
MTKKLISDLLESIDTVHGICPECEDDVILISIVSDFYRCVSCGHDVKQYVNGSIKYLKIGEDDKEWLRKNNLSEV